MSVEGGRADCDDVVAGGCPAPSPTRHSSLALQNARNSDRKNRRVTFPDDDSQLVTGYLEPVIPWSPVEEITNEELIRLYQKSCEKHCTPPLQTIVDQLKVLGMIDGARRGRLSIRGFPLSAPACEALESIFKRIRFNRLELRECCLTDETAVALFDMVEYYESASELDISGNHEFGILGWAACSRMIHKSQCLEQLKACETSLAENTAPALGRSLRNPCNLRCLHLQRSKLAGRPLLCLAGYLKQNKSVRELHLGDNELRAEDAQCLAGMLKGNSSLQLLDVSNNDIQDTGIECIAEALAEQSTMNSPSSGSSSDSPMSSPQSASSGSVQERGLAVLIVWNNNLTRNSGQHFSKALARCQSLEVLNVGQNPLGGETVNRIKGALQKNRSLLSLGMQSSRLGAEAAVALAEVIEDNPVIQRIDLRDNRLQVAGLLAIATALRNNRGVTRIDLDDALTPSNGTSEDRHPIEETRLLAEIRAACKRNLDSPAAPLARKISLTCQTLQATRISIPEIQTPTHLSPPRSQSRPLRSPLPSPIPSPAGSPVPSPSKSSRFKVSRVVDPKEAKTNRFSVIRNVNLSSDCNRSDPEIFTGKESRPELCVCCKSRSTDDLTRNTCTCRGINLSKSEENLADSVLGIPDANILRKCASSTVVETSTAVRTLLDSPDAEISRVMMCDFEDTVPPARPTVEITDFNKITDIAFPKRSDDKKNDVFCSDDLSKCEMRRSILSASSNESSMESSTFEVVSTSQYSNQLNSSVSSNESVSPNMFGKHLKLHGSVTSLEASVSSVDSLKSSNGNNVFNFNADDKQALDLSHSIIDSGFESKLTRNESISSNEGTLTSSSNLRTNIFSKDSANNTLTDCDKTKSLLLDVPVSSSPNSSPRTRKISWISPNPNPVPFHPRADVIENVEPAKPQTNLEKLLSIFQHPIFSRNTDNASIEKKSVDATAASNIRRDSQGSNSSFWSWSLGGSSSSNSSVAKTVAPVVTATVDKLKRFGESFESTSSQDANAEAFYSSSVSAEYTLRLAESKNEIAEPFVAKDDAKKTVERIVQQDKLMDEDKSLSVDDIANIDVGDTCVNNDSVGTPSDVCSELLERQIFNVPLEVVLENTSNSPEENVARRTFQVDIVTSEHDSSPPLLERQIQSVPEERTRSRMCSDTDMLLREYEERMKLNQFRFGRGVEIVPISSKDPNYVLERLAIGDKPIVTTEIVLENRLAGGGDGIAPTLPNDSENLPFPHADIPVSNEKQTLIKNDDQKSDKDFDNCEIVFNPTLALGASDLHRRFLISQIAVQNELEALSDRPECDVSSEAAASPDVEDTIENAPNLGDNGLTIDSMLINYSDITVAPSLNKFCLLPEDGEQISVYIDNIISEARDICRERLSIKTGKENNVSTKCDVLPRNSTNLERGITCDSTKSAQPKDVSFNEVANRSEIGHVVNICEKTTVVLRECEGVESKTLGDKSPNREEGSSRDKTLDPFDKAPCDKVAESKSDIGDGKITEKVQNENNAAVILNKEIDLSRKAVRPSDFQQKPTPKTAYSSVLKQSIGLENKSTPGERQSSPETGPSVDNLPSKIIRRIKENVSPENTLTPSMSNTQTLAKELLETRSVLGASSILENQPQEVFIAKLFGKLDESNGDNVKGAKGFEAADEILEGLGKITIGDNIADTPLKVSDCENVKDKPVSISTGTKENVAVKAVAVTVDNVLNLEISDEINSFVLKSQIPSQTNDPNFTLSNESDEISNTDVPSDMNETSSLDSSPNVDVTSKMDISSKTGVSSEIDFVTSVDGTSEIIVASVGKLASEPDDPFGVDTSSLCENNSPPNTDFEHCLEVSYGPIGHVIQTSSVNLELQPDILKISDGFSIDTSEIEVVTAEEAHNPLAASPEGLASTPSFIDQAKDALAGIFDYAHQIDSGTNIAIVVEACADLITEERVDNIAVDVVQTVPIEIATAVDACSIAELNKTADVCVEACTHDGTFDDVFLPCASKSGENDFKPVSILKNKSLETTCSSSPKDIPDIRKRKPYLNYDRTHPIPSKKSTHDAKNVPLRCGSLPETSSPRSLNPNVTPVGSRSPIGGGTIGKLARDSLYALNVSDEELDRIRYGGQASMESVASLGSVSEDVSQDDELEVSSSSSLLMSVTMETGDE